MRECRHPLEMEMDLQYIDNWSLWHDIVILLKTIPVVIFARGAK